MINKLLTFDAPTSTKKMTEIFDFFFGQYKTYSTTDTTLEIIAVFFGFLSVWFSKNNKIWVFPTGMISTSIFVYLLLKWELLGDMMINGYYFIMSVYGWYIWTRKVDETQVTPISETTKQEKTISAYIFLATLVFVYFVYNYFDKWTSWVAYADTITTAIFFVGMWLMAKRKIENWLFWIVGNIISVPLYFYKGFTFTSFQYLGFTFIAIFGYLAWKKSLVKNPLTS
jgi:nicotinamide mononucleotide transporter